MGTRSPHLRAPRGLQSAGEGQRGLFSQQCLRPLPAPVSPRRAAPSPPRYLPLPSPAGSRRLCSALPSPGHGVAGPRCGEGEVGSPCSPGSFLHPPPSTLARGCCGVTQPARGTPGPAARPRHAATASLGHCLCTPGARGAPRWAASHGRALAQHGRHGAAPPALPGTASPCPAEPTRNSREFNQSSKP